VQLDLVFFMREEEPVDDEEEPVDEEEERTSDLDVEVIDVPEHNFRSLEKRPEELVRTAS